METVPAVLVQPLCTAFLSVQLLTSLLLQEDSTASMQALLWSASAMI